MATLYGVNADSLLNSVPVEAVPGFEAFGKVRVSYDKHTFAADVNAINDIINMGHPIPKGAKILDAVVFSESMGTTGIFQFGTSADPDRYVASTDAGGAAAKASMASEAGLFEQLSADAQPQLKLTEATDDAAGKTIHTAVYYIID